MPYARTVAALLLTMAACSASAAGDAASNVTASDAGDAASADGGGGSSEGGADGADGHADDGGTPAPPITTFRNPLNAGPDPFMTFHAGHYYLATTQGDALRIWKSPTLGDLLSAPPTTIWQDSDPSRNREIWAPSFYFLGNHWYVYYTADDGTDANHRLYVIESDGTDLLGPYHFKAKLSPPGADDWAIDPVLLPQNGQLYLLWSGAGPEGHNLIYIAPLSEPWTISGPRVYLPASGGCPEVREAPAIVQHGGMSYLVYSTCDTGKPDYQLWMKSIPMNADPMVPGNWRQFPSAVFARDDAAGVWGPGSNGFFKSPDGSEDWIVYHGKNTSQYTYDGRDTRAQKITWNPDGTPSFGAPVAVDATLPLPAGDPGGASYWINDDGSSSGGGSVSFAGAWNAYPQCGIACFHGDDHGTNQSGATATFTFTGTQIALLSAEDAGNGIAAIAIDGHGEVTVDYYLPKRQGQQIVYVSPRLAHGPHTLKLRVTGNKNPAAVDAYVSVDRAEVWTN